MVPEEKEIKVSVRANKSFKRVGTLQFKQSHLDRLVSDDMAEKIRKVLVAKREVILEAQDREDD